MTQTTTSSKRPIVVVSQWIHDSVIQALEPHAELRLNQSKATQPGAVIRRQCVDATGLLAFMSDRIDAAFLDACPQLRVIGAALKGYDNIDLAACSDRNIWVSIVPDLLTAPTAELAIALGLALGRHLCAGHNLIKTGSFSGWQPILYGQGFADTRVGIIGLGAVGQAIANRLTGFACSIRATDPGIDPRSTTIPLVALEDLLGWADWLFLAAPLTPTSHLLLDAERLALVQASCRVVNIGRGALVDEQAIADALSQASLAGYAADVFACEDRSLVNAPNQISPMLLAHTDKTVFTPHLGSAVDQVREAIALAAAGNIIDVLGGRAPREAINQLPSPTGA